MIYNITLISMFALKHFWFITESSYKDIIQSHKIEIYSLFQNSKYFSHAVPHSGTFGSIINSVTFLHGTCMCS